MEAYLKSGQSIILLHSVPKRRRRNGGAFFITPVHPLVRQAAAHFVADKPLHVHLAYDLPGVPSGDYPISIYAWDYIGVRSDFRLVVVCEESHLAEELPEYLLSATTVESPANCSKEHGTPWRSATYKCGKKNGNAILFLPSVSLPISWNVEEQLPEQKKRCSKAGIAEMKDLRITTMHKAALKNATERYHQRVAVIEAQSQMADIHTTLIATA